MRIAYDVTNPYSPGSTGIGTYSKALVEAMKNTFPENEYLLCVRDSRLKKIARDKKAFINNRIKGANVSHHAAFKGFLMPMKKPDIWHGLDVWLPDKYTGNSKIVFTVHDLVVFSHPELLKPNYVRAMRKKFERYFNEVIPDAVIAISEQTSREIKLFFPSISKKVHVVHQGVSSFWRPVATVHPFRNDFKYFLFVSTLEPRKNFRAAREAFLSLSPKGVKLVVVGKNNDEKEELFDSKNIIQLGYCDKNHLRILYNHSAGLLFTSIYEGFGLPPLEALSCNCPVIAERSLPCSDFLPEMFKTDCKDIESIKEKMRFFLETQERKNLHLYVKDLTWTCTAEKTFAIYKKLLNK
ncbi:glycosyltransferase family 4 protein [candidate division WOR-3 bacterium]|nr:glycosyltransferase family 4 protein [candidate division WOR-3 bacterium]